MDCSDPCRSRKLCYFEHTGVIYGIYGSFACCDSRSYPLAVKWPAWSEIIALRNIIEEFPFLKLVSDWKGHSVFMVHKTLENFRYFLGHLYIYLLLLFFFLLLRDCNIHKEMSTRGLIEWSKKKKRERESKNFERITTVGK